MWQQGSDLPRGWPSNFFLYTSIFIVMDVDSRRLVGVKPERVTNISSTDYPGHYPGEDHSWDLNKFRHVRYERMSCKLELTTVVFGSIESQSSSTAPL